MPIAGFHHDMFITESHGLEITGHGNRKIGRAGSFEKVKNHVIWDVVLKLNHPKEDLTNYVDVMLI